MKIRIASMMLAFGLIFPLTSLAFANEVVPEEEEVTVEPTAVFYLDGEPLYDVVAKCIGGTYYVTLASMMSQIDAGAVVEESSGIATLTAEAVVVTESVAESLNEETEQTEVLAEAETPIQEGEAVAEVLDTLTLTAEVGREYVVANGRYLYAEGGVIALDGAVAIPVRVLAEALNMSASYDGENGFVNLTRSSEIGYLEDAETFYPEDAIYWLSRIIYSESGNQALSGKIAVGNVVLNRVNSGRFPDTIYEVIFQKNQFSPAASGSIYREPNEASVVAAKLVLDGAKVLDDVLFFNRAGLSCYASRNRTYVATIGDHSFYA